MYDVSVVIPTYRRERVLVDTVRALLQLSPPVGEILLVDQTERHESATQQVLQTWADAGRIGWLRLATPSIPVAMNRGLLAARGEFVLFLDDDIIPEPELVSAHIDAHRQTHAGLVAGRIIQTWEEDLDFAARDELGFHFAGLRARWIDEFMGGNFSVRRDTAIALGGFDENFVRVAYRFEAEFADRWLQTGHRIYFAPRACIHHLKAISGGTRTFGDHLKTAKPDHAVGEYYFLLRAKGAKQRFRRFLTRPLQALATRHHLRRPWWIPATLGAELLGIVWAIGLYLRGPRLLRQSVVEGPST
ncbi:MAG: glycosyltransferase family 2 protein [Gammaproteobacteria bacterium]|nr:glycosyltransferase family 2 protein [Gammaproteobacteria bacterium]